MSRHDIAKWTRVHQDRLGVSIALIPVILAAWCAMGVIVSPGDTAACGSDVPNGTVLPLCFLFFIGGAAAALLG